MTEIRQKLSGAVKQMLTKNIFSILGLEDQ